MISGETVWLTGGGAETEATKSHLIYEVKEEANNNRAERDLARETELRNNHGKSLTNQPERNHEFEYLDKSIDSEKEIGRGQAVSNITKIPKDLTKSLSQPKIQLKALNHDESEKIQQPFTKQDEINESELKKVQHQSTKHDEIIEDGIDSDSDSESGFDTDLENDEQMSDNYLQEQKEKYLATCRRIGVAPVTTLLNSLSKRALKLSHQGLGSNGIRAIASVLKVNTSITELDLSDNNIDDDGTRTLARMLRENLYVSDLDLSFNNLCSPGLEQLMNTFKNSNNIKHLKLSKTGLKDRHVHLIADVIQNNDVITSLSLSQNELGVNSGLYLGPAISSNSKIRNLDLSWNHIRNEGAIAFGNSLNSNNSITVLNLAWNGFADNGAEAVGRALQVNSTLIEIDLSYNRVTEKGSSHLANGLRWNCILKILKLNWNPLKTQGVNLLVEGLNKNESSSLVELQLNGVVIDHNCKAAVEDLSTRRQCIKIDVGGVTSSGPMFTNVNQVRREIVEIIVAYLAKNRLRMLDLFNQWDKDKSMTLTRNEFSKGIKNGKIPISEMQLSFMLDWLDQDGNDEIEYNEFVSITEVE